MLKNHASNQVGYTCHNNYKHILTDAYISCQKNHTISNAFNF